MFQTKEKSGVGFDIQKKCSKPQRECKAEINVDQSKLSFFSQNKGWILLEALIGTVIIATALVALALAFTQASKNTADSKNRMQALSIAQQELESLKRYDDQASPALGFSAGTPLSKTNGVYTVKLEQIVVSEVTSLTQLIPVKVTVASPSGQSVQIIEYILVK